MHTRYAVTLVIAFFCSSSTWALAQQSPTTAAAQPAAAAAGIKLAVVSETRTASTPTTLSQSFVFSQSVHDLTKSAIFWQFSKNGVVGPTQSVLATLDGGHPDTITIPISAADISGNDSVTTYVQLIDAAGNVLATTPPYERDLAVYKVVADNQNTIQTLNKQLTDANNATAAKQAAIDAIINKILPSSIALQRTIVSDNMIELTYTTPSPGRLRIVNTNTNASKDTDQGTVHIVLFDRLANGTAYNFTASVLDLQGNPTPTKTLLSQNTLTTLPTFSPAISITSTPGVINIAAVADPMGSYSVFLPAGATIKTAFSVSYRQQVSTAPLSFGPTKQAYSIDADALGMPTAAALSTTSNFSLTGLQEGQTYALTIKAVNEFGQAYTTETTSVVAKAPPPPTPLDFDGPVNFQITAASGITASWKANTAPKANSAAVIIEFAGSPDNTIRMAAQSDATSPLSFKLTSSNADLLKAVNAALNGATPTIDVQMIDGVSGKPVDRQFTFVFAVQNANKKASAGASSASAATASQNLVNASNNPTKTKLSWQDLVASGLGIVLKAL